LAGRSELEDFRGVVVKLLVEVVQLLPALGFAVAEVARTV
jgi:hypothetical protein